MSVYTIVDSSGEPLTASSVQTAMCPSGRVMAMGSAVCRGALHVVGATGLLTCATTPTSPLLRHISLPFGNNVAAREHGAEGGGIGPNIRYISSQG